MAFSVLAVVLCAVATRPRTPCGVAWLVAIGSGQCVGGVEIREHALVGDVEHALHEGGHLFFRRRAAPRDGLFDLRRGVFVNRYLAGDGGGDDYALRPAEFEHRLHIFAEKRCLDRQFVGMKRIDHAHDALVDASEFEVNIAHLAQIDHPHRDHFCFLAADGQ